MLDGGVPSFSVANLETIVSAILCLQDQPTVFLFCCLVPDCPSALSSQTPQNYCCCQPPEHTYLQASALTSLVRVYARHDEVALEGMGHFCGLAKEKCKGSQVSGTCETSVAAAPFSRTCRSPEKGGKTLHAAEAAPVLRKNLRLTPSVGVPGTLARRL